MPVPSTSKEEISKPLPKYDPEFGVYQLGDQFFIGDKLIDKYTDSDGQEHIIIDDGKKSHVLTNGLYNLLTYKDPKPESYNANDISTYKQILAYTNNMYVNNDPKTEKFKLEDETKIAESSKWSNIIAPSWERMQGKKKRTGKKGKKGSGVKKVVIPADPNALLEKLDLLMASKSAGNTGVRNELVSVCDELKRQGIFDSEIYKKNNVRIIKI